MRHGYNGGVTMTWSTGTFAYGSRFILLSLSSERSQAGPRILAASAAVAAAAAATSVHVTTDGFLANGIVTDDT